MDFTLVAGLPDPNDPRQERDPRKRMEDLMLSDPRFRLQTEAQKRGMAFADLDRVQIDANAIASVPLSLIRGQRALPVKRDGNTLWVAFDEVDTNSVERIKEATGLRVIPVMCMPEALDEAIEKYA